jgi:hypothetical protein
MKRAARNCIRRVGALAERCEHVGVPRQLKACGSDAHHGIWFAVKNKRSADGQRIAPKALLPQTAADDGDGRRARPVFFGLKAAPVQSCYCQGGE